jgi:ketosteroid isomerase-like protein
MLGEGDLDGVMSDYAEDAVFISADGVLKGRAAIREMFADLITEFADAETEFVMDVQVVADDYAYIVWHADTPETEYEFATDTFVVRDGEIVAQTLAAQVS